MAENKQTNSMAPADLLPHLKSPDLIEQLYPRMIAPEEYGDRDSEGVAQAELWVSQD